MIKVDSIRIANDRSILRHHEELRALGLWIPHIT